MIKNDVGKQFDCIKMKNSIQKQIYDETKNMSVIELLNYYNGVSLDRLPKEEARQHAQITNNGPTPYNLFPSP